LSQFADEETGSEKSSIQGQEVRKWHNLDSSFQYHTEPDLGFSELPFPFAPLSLLTPFPLPGTFFSIKTSPARFCQSLFIFLEHVLSELLVQIYSHVAVFSAVLGGSLRQKSSLIFVFRVPGTLSNV
jgi:hypothetical protein